VKVKLAAFLLTLALALLAGLPPAEAQKLGEVSVCWLRGPALDCGRDHPWTLNSY